MAAVRHLRFLKVRNTVNPWINAGSQLNTGSPINASTLIDVGYDGMYGRQFSHLSNYTLHDVKLYVIFIFITSKAAAQSFTQQAYTARFNKRRVSNKRRGVLIYCTFIRWFTVSAAGLACYSLLCAYVRKHFVIRKFCDFSYVLFTISS